MYTVLWQKMEYINGQEVMTDLWERLETKEDVKALLEELGKDPNVILDDVLIFSPEANNYAYDAGAFLSEKWKTNL